jgi:hypothetical protein
VRALVERYCESQSNELGKEISDPTIINNRLNSTQEEFVKLDRISVYLSMSVSELRNCYYCYFLL